jgi:enamine deaminase RidA (YjgF/YER057c/UK114 family)
MEGVTKLTVYPTDLADLGAFCRMRDEYIRVDQPPACSLVQVVGLVHPAFRVEIDALAVLPLDQHFDRRDEGWTKVVLHLDGAR